MKRTGKLLSLALALLMLVTCFAACGGDTETPAETSGETNAPPVSGPTETEDPREAVKDDIPLDLNFANEDDNTITFFTRDDNELWKYEMDVDELLDDTLYDAIYYRNKAVEERLGVEITTIQQNGTYTKRNEWNETLRNCVNTKTGAFDTAAIYLSTGSALAVEGMYYNVLDFPNLSLDKPWWNKTIQDETTLFDTLYYLAGDIAITETAAGFAIFYNKALFDKYYATSGIDLYKMVDDGAWTIDELHNLVTNVWEDTNSSGGIDDGDEVGFVTVAPPRNDDGGMDAWVAAMGIRVTEMVDGIPELCFYNERTIAAYEKVRNLHVENPGTLTGTGKESTTFLNGKVLFIRQMINAGSNLRDMRDPYGVLPMPKFDVDQENYQTICENTASLVVVLSSLPSAKCEMVGAALELMAAESYKKVTPEYYEIALKSKYSNDPRDAAMYDLILGTYTFSFGHCYSTLSIGGVGGLFRFMEDDFAQKYTANETKYQTALETLIDKLDEVAFNAQFGA